jgi:hypothetical protein
MTVCLHLSLRVWLMPFVTTRMWCNCRLVCKRSSFACVMACPPQQILTKFHSEMLHENPHQVLIDTSLEVIFFHSVVYLVTSYYKMTGQGWRENLKQKKKYTNVHSRLPLTAITMVTIIVLSHYNPKSQNSKWSPTNTADFQIDEQSDWINICGPFV